MGVHGPLAIRGDEDETAGRRRAPLHGLCRKAHPGGAQIMGENLAELVVGDLAHEGGLAAERRNTDASVRHRCRR